MSGACTTRGGAETAGAEPRQRGRGRSLATPAGSGERSALDVLGARLSGLRTARGALGGCGAAIMSTAMNFGSKTFQPRPPDKGSFPLDHFGERRRPGVGASGRAPRLSVSGGGAV